MERLCSSVMTAEKTTTITCLVWKKNLIGGSMGKSSATFMKILNCWRKLCERCNESFMLVGFRLGIRIFNRCRVAVHEGAEEKMINRTILVGRLVADPELRYTPAGIPVCKFRLAVNRIFKNEGEQQADFINCIAWRKQAENLANYMRKGSLVGIDGRIQTGSYEDQDGKKVFYTEVVAESIQFLESKNAQNGPNSAPNYQGNTNYQSSNQNAYTAQNHQNNDPFSGYSSLPDDIDDNLPF